MLCMSGEVDADSLARPPDAPISADMRFRILEGDTAVGTFTIHISGDDKSMVVVSISHLSVKRLLLQASLNRRVEEHWSEGRFDSLSADLQTSGTLGSSHKTLNVSRNPDGTLSARYNAESHSLPSVALPMTLWGPRVLHDGVFFDAAKGELINVKIAPAEKTAPALTYEGRVCEAKRVETDSPEDGQFVIWLDSDGTLCGLRQRSALVDLRYEREASASAP